MWILQATILEWVAMPSSGDLPNPGIEPRSLALHADSLPAEPQRKPRIQRAILNMVRERVLLTERIHSVN